MIPSQKSRDFDLAYDLHEEINCLGVTENAILPKNGHKEKYKPRTLIDQTLEYIDPTPNIHTLFVQFNSRFFWNVLLPVEVKWSTRMTSCAGVCTFHSRNRQCVISLSAPLLKLRPRKDLVETLLHEMIHGYLFLTNNNRDRDGHGPEFCKHMQRINKEAGTNITIYHSFHDEVRLYQQHWWRCNGPCQKKKPYFGMVRRAMNRAPGPSDFWWKEHQQTCGGQFIKIKEPEKTNSKNAKNNEKNAKDTKNEKVKVPPKNNTERKISNWFTNDSMKTSTPKSTPILKQSKVTNFSGTRSNTSSVTVTTAKRTDNQKSLVGIKKLGNTTNNVHGWGTGGPSGLAQSPSNSKNTPKTPNTGRPKFSFSSTLGGANSGQSILLKKFIDLKNNSQKTAQSIPPKHVPEQSEPELTNCPICDKLVPVKSINDHVDLCINDEKRKTHNNTSHNNVQPANLGPPSLKRKLVTEDFPSKQPRSDIANDSKTVQCPICNKDINSTEINDHLDKCLLTEDTQCDNATILNNSQKRDSVIVIDSDSSTSAISLDETNNISSTSNHDNKAVKTDVHKCVICDAIIPPEMSMDEHLEDCIGTVFNDKSTEFSDDESTDETKENAAENNKYPCPVCMELICENLMNEHLDQCLTGE